MKKILYKTPSQSITETRYLIMPEHANPYGTVFGGIIMSWIDITAAMAAERHCGYEVVTACIDRISFIAPIYIGDHVVIKATVNYAGKTSMEIGVDVIKENPRTGEKINATKAYLTFVALGKNKKPIKIPKIKPETQDQIMHYKNAEIRVFERKKILKKNQE